MNTITLITVTLLTLGFVLISIATLRTYHLVRLLTGKRYHARWEFMLFLMFLFIVGYLVSIWFVASNIETNLILLMGSVFFAGAIFVLMVVNTSFLSLNELFKTTVSRDYVENVIGSMADTLIVMKLDDANNIITINKATTNLLKYNGAEIIGKSFNHVIGESPKTQALIHEIIEKGKVFDREILYVKKNGEKVPVLFSGSALKDINGKAEGIVCVGHDISERKKAQEALQSANSMKELLLDILTHDLINPVGTIERVTGILRKEDSSRIEYSMLQTAIQGLFNVIKNATTLSQVAMSEKISKKPLDIVKLIRKVQDDYKTSIVHTKMEIENHLPDQLEVQANPIIIEVVNIYMSNALKYAVDGKKLIINYVIDEGYHIFGFKDFGETISDEKRKLIFNRRLQKKNTASNSSGLGLAIVKRIMIAHQGDAWVVSNKPKGNIFYFSLPYV